MINIIRNLLNGLCLLGKFGRKIIKIRNRIGYDNEEIAWKVLEIAWEILEIASEKKS